MFVGSNCAGIWKLYPVTVRLFDVNFSRFMTKFLNMNVMEGKEASTVANMFKSVDNLVSKFNLL